MRRVYGEKLKELEVWQRHDGKHDVYIRKNIVPHTEAAENGEITVGEEADEVHFITTATKAEIEADLDAWWDYGVHYEPDPEDAETKLQRAEEKIRELEEIILELSEAVYA